MRIKGSLLIVALVLFCIPAAVAEEAPAMPQPTAEHKLLGKWLGHWSGTGELKATPMGPGGTMTWTEDCSWFGGTEFSVVCKSKGDGPMGSMKGLGIIGYDPGKKVYTHYGVDSTGWSGFAEGSRDGDVWTFESDVTMEGNTFHSRFKMNMVSPNEMTFVWEMSQDGKDWMVLMDGTSRKK